MEPYQIINEDLYGAANPNPTKHCPGRLPIITFCGNASNGVSNLPEAIAAQPGATVELPLQVPGHRLLTFIGWSYGRFCGGVLLQPGDAITMPEVDTTLYAMWQRNSSVDVTVAFDANTDGDECVTCMPCGIQAPAGRSICMPRMIPRRCNCAFTGWNTAPDASGVEYLPCQVFMAEENMTLYAQWKRWC